MMLCLQRYTFTIVYRKGSTMWLAETLLMAPLSWEQAQVDSFEVFVTENIQITSKPKRITDHTHSVIQCATQDDPILSRIIPYIQHGWPDKRTALERNLANYWTFRWELAYIDSVLYKGDQITIPTAMRRRLLEKNPCSTPRGRKINS